MRFFFHSFFIFRSHCAVKHLPSQWGSHQAFQEVRVQIPGQLLLRPNPRYRLLRHHHSWIVSAKLFRRRRERQRLLLRLEEAPGDPLPDVRPHLLHEPAHRLAGGGHALPEEHAGEEGQVQEVRGPRLLRDVRATAGPQEFPELQPDFPPDVASQDTTTVDR